MAQDQADNINHGFEAANVRAVMERLFKKNVRVLNNSAEQPIFLFADKQAAGELESIGVKVTKLTAVQKRAFPKIDFSEYEYQLENLAEALGMVNSTGRFDESAKEELDQLLSIPKELPALKKFKSK